MKKTMSPTLRAALILLSMTTVCTLFLAGGNLFYEDVLASRQRSLRMEILAGFGEKFDEDSFDGIFQGRVAMEELPKEKAWIYRFQGTPRQAALDIRGPGLWDVIRLLVFFDLEAGRFKEVRLISQAETPGLGDRIKEEWFLNQFRNLDFKTAVKIVKQRTGADGEADAISGATNTSRAVEDILNRAAALAGK